MPRPGGPLFSLYARGVFGAHRRGPRRVAEFILPAVLCKVGLGPDQNIPHNAWTTVAFDEVLFNRGFQLDLIADAYHVRIPSTGFYLILVELRWRPDSESLRRCLIRRQAGNLGLAMGHTMTTAADSAIVYAFNVSELSPGALIRAEAWQNSGLPLNIGGDPPPTQTMTIIKVD